MIWLAWHMWILLALAFLLGLFMGWWLFWKREHRPDETTEANPSRMAPEHSAPRTKVPPPPAPTPVMMSPAMPVLYDRPDKGDPDNLQRISGIGPRYEKLLNELGVFYYAQIAHWTQQEIAWLDNRLGFPGRIARDKWQEQARLLLLGASVGPTRRTPANKADKDPPHEPV
ncbi:hypothetical protein [Aquisalinus flavus]|uniref:Uncharacterized protein n=1 Tax=Aquisalinus flavus TaxID=1526572 RepID=A0A8J2V270_9PROT|nr:hypothetical protein [Aquisalinus flavus]MBD0427085.1 hypothetical protein [Aquisalinus flavus]UNE46908.1 hypothetical protein FF099_01975 [Aquisalinus flavus]GGC98252.1 hypothetical protein GCM10011342_03990 [Aquisalinus flavus]